MTEINDTLAALKGIPTQKQLLDALQHTVMTIEFTKKDGSKRVMDCTQSKMIIEEYGRGSVKGTGKKKADNIVTVWDLENNAWRSIRFETIKEVRDPVFAQEWMFAKELTEAVRDDIDQEVIKEIQHLASTIKYEE